MPRRFVVENVDAACLREISSNRGCDQWPVEDVGVAGSKLDGVFGVVDVAADRERACECGLIVVMAEDRPGDGLIAEAMSRSVERWMGCVYTGVASILCVSIAVAFAHCLALLRHDLKQICCVEKQSSCLLEQPTMSAIT